MTYEEYLDEVTTLIYELYEVPDTAAVRMVMAAQDAEFFVAHDDDPAMRTPERARQDAAAVFKQFGAKPSRKR